MEAFPREVIACQDDNGAEPFTDWLNSLDKETRAVVINRVDRVENGNFGDVKFVGEGVYELRIDHGPGYRVYFGQEGLTVHLIRGGNKSTQQADIETAQRFWNQHD